MSLRTRLLAGGLLGLALLAVFLRGIDWSALAAAFGRAKPAGLAGVVLATLATFSLRAWRWGYLLRPLARVPYTHLFSATYVGFMSGLLIPRAGEVVRPYLVARRHQLSTSGAFASIILERLVDLITVLGLFGLYLLVLPLPPQQRTGPLLGMLKVGGALAGAAALAVLLALLAYHAYTDRALALLERLLRHLPERWAELALGGLRSFGDGLAVLRAPAPHLLMIGLQSVAVWMAIALGIYWNNLAFGLDLGFTTTFLIIGFLTVGVAIPTPGMVGGFHESYLLALTQAFGADRDVAAAAGIALHALNNLPVLVLGLALIGGEGLTLGRVAALAERPPDDPPGGDPAGNPTGGD